MIVGWSTAPRGQVMNETLGQLADGPRVLARTESSRTQSGDETGWTTARSLGEVGTTSVHSKPAFACNDCTFLDEIHRAPSGKSKCALFAGEPRAASKMIKNAAATANTAAQGARRTGATLYQDRFAYRARRPRWRWVSSRAAVPVASPPVVG